MKRFFCFLDDPAFKQAGHHLEPDGFHQKPASFD